jgi:NTE family protein
MLGALAALQEKHDWDPRDAALMVGTSAGSVMSALLRSGQAVDELYTAHAEETATARATDLPDAGPLPGLPHPPDEPDREPGWPGLTGIGPGSLPLLLQAVRTPLKLTPSAVCSALLPRGRRPLTRIESFVRAVHPDDRWPGGTWIVATDYHTGRRVTFGRAGSPTTSLARAVAASCAVPAWYEPVTIDGLPHIDGGVCSPCNADLLAGSGLDEVYVLAPMAATEHDRPRDPLTWLERRWRRSSTKRVCRELDKLRAAGIRATLLTPNATDLEVMGFNMMDGARRRDVLLCARETVTAQLSEKVSEKVSGTAHLAAAA